MAQLSIGSSEYIDPISSVIDTDNFNSKSISSITSKFPSFYSKITSNCSIALKIYKKLLNMEYELNSWEFLTLKTSININFNLDQNLKQQSTRKFDIKIAKAVIERCGKIDDEISIQDRNLNNVISFISGLTIQEYISDPGTLLLKIYFKILNLKTIIIEKINISYTKSKLLIISFELKQITDMINEQENPLVGVDTDFQSTLEGYKDFVTVLINQLDQAVQDKDSEQIQECLSILNDVEKMYETVRMNFFYTEEWNQWEQEQLSIKQAAEAEAEAQAQLEKERERQSRSRSRYSNSPLGSSPLQSPSPYLSIDDEIFEDDSILNSPSQQHHQQQFHKHLHSQQNHHHSLQRRSSISSTTSSIATFNRHPTTISEELPYLLQAFDEAKQLEQELSTYQTQSSRNIPKPPTKPFANSSSTRSSSPNSSQQYSSSPNNSHPNPLNNYDKKKSNLQTYQIPNIGFNNNLLNSIYGLNPKSSSSTSTTKFNSNSNLHNEID
ncbi:Mitochondrial distribution and morphology protein 36 [Wickerhamomyces ciferrii]|uniref:Mitochondrial distribution and morphology protein 36 n=1 Tax=Wickerhamomyces ciferrii (strain ATCC 14091 / BCRC 22168 / CBS 111 / JCM 3599 / NBRC 0793 / NRRL Y-1031 F-60-10) TaxID=1206466 RepID=K0KM10_WICCF|nr:Mitochondrial distribution and morphology protein 36 [Wickerhamomyces ciferrii]CCH44041.1 Mitochondrial distribution and morphology protein 36 [Wickerhamomyces ciferrii]